MIVRRSVLPCKVRVIPDRRLQRTRAAVFSSWQYHGDSPLREATEEDIRRARKLVALKRQRDELSQSIQKAVRRHLHEKYPLAFDDSCRSTKSIWKDIHIKESVSEKAQLLLGLNGFQSVAVPTQLDSLFLAEGVAAKPNYYSRLSRSNAVPFSFYVQPYVPNDPDGASKGDSKYPTIVQEDIQIYRILENQAERFIRQIYSWWQDFVHRRIFQPIELVYLRTDALFRGQQSSDSNAKLGTVAPNTSTVAVVPLASEIAEEPKENLLVLGHDELVLYACMTPSVRLVTLPYVLGHKAASTLVSVSLVVFGAIPLASRSLNFAFLYPGLSEAIAASVVVTISYGLWSSRSKARTSQSQVVADALLQRVQARDDAVLLVLQEGAVQQAARGVLAAYFDRLELPSKERTFLSIPMAPTTIPNDLMDPSEFAQRMGLIVVDPGTPTSRPTTPMSAIPLNEASSTVQQHILDTNGVVEELR